MTSFEDKANKLTEAEKEILISKNYDDLLDIALSNIVDLWYLKKSNEILERRLKRLNKNKYQSTEWQLLEAKFTYEEMVKILNEHLKNEIKYME